MLGQTRIIGPLDVAGFKVATPGEPPAGNTLVWNAAIGEWNYGAGGSGGEVVPVSYTVATLPAAAASVGMFASITDALAPVIYDAVVGGGAAFAVVVSNGTIWRVLIV